MSVSHVGVLSSTFVLKPKVPGERREDGKKVHKVSLVSNSSTTNSSVLLGHAVGDYGNDEKDTVQDSGLSEWKPRCYDYRGFEAESRSFLTDRSESEVLGSTHLYSSSSECEPSTHSSSYTPEWESLPSAVSLDTADSHRNTTCWNARSEVQVSGESKTGGRGWAGLDERAGESEVEREEGITNSDSHYSTEETDGFFSGIFKATRVDFSPTEVEPEAPTLTSPHDMDTLVDTLKSMPLSVRHRSLRSTSHLGVSSLPPIDEDAGNTTAVGIGIYGMSSPTSLAPPEPLPSLLPDLGLKWGTSKDMRSPLTMMTMLKEQQQGQDPQGRSVVLPQRASALNSIVMRKNSLPNINLDEGPQFNGLLGSSRLDKSLLFSNYRSEQTEENGKPSGLLAFRAASLPDVSSGHDYLSKMSKGPESLGSAGSTFELSFLTSSPSSLPGLMETSRISRSPLVIHSPTPESPTSNSTPLQHSLSVESPTRPQSLQWDLSMGTSSVGSPVQNGVRNNFGMTQETGPDRNLLAKYKAFPDAYVSNLEIVGQL